MGLVSAAKARRWLVVDALRTRLWPVPVVAVTVAAAAGVATTRLDEAIDRTMANSLSYYLFGGGPSAAREVLGAVASSLITVTSLTFSLTLVTLQLASSQFSPRLLRTFARDRFVQRTLALFLATFVYALTVLRTVRDGVDGDPNFVPKISVTLAYLLALVSVIALVLFLAHLVREIRVETMLRNVYADAMETADGCLSPRPESGTRNVPPPRTPPHAALVMARCSGFLVHVDDAAMLAVALDAAAVIAVTRSPGEWLTAGTPIAAIWPLAPESRFEPAQLSGLQDRTAAEIHTDHERTPVQDLAYGLRLLTDVANKALSPGINDPTTAIHALGHSSSLLCELATRHLGTAVLTDGDGAARVVMPRPDLAGLLDLAVSQPRHYGAGDAEVLTRLFTLLRELAWCTGESAAKEVVAGQLVRLRRTVSEQDFDETERSGLDRAGKDVEAALAGRWI